MFDPSLIPEGHHLDVRPDCVLVVDQEGTARYVIEDDHLVPYLEWFARTYVLSPLAAVVTNPPGYVPPSFDPDLPEHQVESYGLDPNVYRVYLGTDPPVVVVRETCEAAFRIRNGHLEPVTSTGAAGSPP